MNRASELLDTVIQAALRRPRTLALVVLLAPPAVAVGVKSAAVDPAPAQDSAEITGPIGSRGLDVASLDREIADKLAALEVLELELERARKEWSPLLPSGFESGELRLEPTEPRYLVLRPHLIDPERSAPLPATRVEERPDLDTLTVLVGEDGSSGGSALPDLPEGPQLEPDGPRPPHGAPEIDPNLATAGLLLLAGGTLVLTGRRRPL